MARRMNRNVHVRCRTGEKVEIVLKLYLLLCDIIMGKYFKQLNPETKKYFKILSEEFPEWLEDYIATEEMQRISKISMSCGTDYSKCFNVRYWYSNLDHSVGVALIIWNFTHDKKQTLAGLFHDIATPVFKHTIDFMNRDYVNQESTEELTKK